MTSDGDPDPVIEAVEITPTDLYIYMGGVSVPPDVPSSFFDSVPPDIQMALLSLMRAIGNRKNRSEGGLLTLEQVAELLHVPVSVLREEEVLRPKEFDPHREPD